MGVQAEVSRFLQGERVSASWVTFGDLDAAFQSASEFANVPTIYLVLPTRSKWSVLWNNSFLCDGYDSLCYNLTKNHGLRTLHWSAHDHWTSFQSGALFVHRQRNGGELVERSVYVVQEDKRWSFGAVGYPLPEEDLHSYEARRKQDRLNEQRLASFLARLGAQPWLEQFYALPEIQVFVLRREAPPTTITRRSVDDVLRLGQPLVSADAGIAPQFQIGRPCPGAADPGPNRSVSP
jgi:hypothetical protein